MAHLLDDALRDRAHVPVGVTRGHDHRIGNVSQSAYVQQFDIDCLHVIQRREHELFESEVASRCAARASGLCHAGRLIPFIKRFRCQAEHSIRCAG